MQVLEEMLIGRVSVRGTEAVIHAFNPATNAAIGPAFDGRGAAEVDHA
jgi:alpha-ketoglutaric semialdehyde dehydrogenase